MKIIECINHHHYLSYLEKCPYCGKEKMKEYEIRKGDCIDCGAFCPEYAYGCNYK